MRGERESQLVRGRCNDLVNSCSGMLSGKNVGMFGTEMPEPELLVICRSCPARGKKGVRKR